MPIVQTSPDSFTNPFNELQFLARMLAHPDEIELFPRGEEVIHDDLVNSALKAVRKTRSGNLGIVASAMKSNGFPEATPERLAAEVGRVTSLVDPESINPYMMHDELARLFVMRTGVPKVERLLQDWKTSRLPSTTQAVSRVIGELEQLLGYGEMEEVSTDTWAAQFTAWQEVRRELVSSGRAPRYPDWLPILRDRIGLMEYGLYVVVADTGVGKTDLVDMLGHTFAYHGEQVTEGNTESSPEQMAQRVVLRRAEGVRMEQLAAGFLTPGMLEALEPYPKGSVRYVNASGVPLRALVAKAKRSNSHLIVDVFHDARLNEFRQPGYNVAETLMDALQYLSDYAVTNHRVVWITVQIDKNARLEVRQQGRLVVGADAFGGSVYEGKASGVFTLNFPKLVNDFEIVHPLTRQKVIMPKYSMSRLGMLVGEKGRNFEGGVRQMLWHERNQRLMIGLDNESLKAWGHVSVNVDYYAQAFNAMYDQIREKAPSSRRR